MRKTLRKLIPPLTVILFAAISITPLLHQRMTCSDDGAFSVHKALGLELAIQMGDWFPRWSPHMAHGFALAQHGYPAEDIYDAYQKAAALDPKAVAPLVEMGKLILATVFTQTTTT